MLKLFIDAVLLPFNFLFAISPLPDEFDVAFLVLGILILFFRRKISEILHNIKDSF
jgi:hypothetical protein